jgi:hypothetical protein
MGYVDEDIKHLRWIQSRLIKVHGENPNVDYMVKFKAILDELRDEYYDDNPAGICLPCGNPHEHCQCD